MSKRHAILGSGGVQFGLIITPMLDMSFQILSFFIMSYNPSALEAQVPSKLAAPALATSGPKGPAEPIPSVAPDEVEDALAETVTVKLTAAAPGTEGRKAGWPREVVLTSKTNPAPEPVLNAKDRLTDEGGLFRTKLPDRLKAIRREAGKDKVVFRIEADGDVRHDWVVQAYDVARQAGFADVRFVPAAKQK